MCCLRPDVECIAETTSFDPIGSCKQIIAFQWLKIVVAILMIVITVSNFTCTVLWIRESKKMWKAKQILSYSLCMADMIMATYLLILFVTDTL